MAPVKEYHPTFLENHSQNYLQVPDRNVKLPILYPYPKNQNILLGNYRHHKREEDGADTKDVREEVADMFIYIMDLALIVGMTAEELLEEVSKKQDKNLKRQEEGY